MADPVHVVLKFKDSIYNVDTIAEHRKLLAEKGSVIWGLIKPSTRSRDMAPKWKQQIREQIRDGIPTYAFLSNQGRLTHRARVVSLLDNDEVITRSEHVPLYYHDALNRCPLGFEFSVIQDLPAEEAARVMRYGGRTLVLNNQTNPLYASYAVGAQPVEQAAVSKPPAPADGETTKELLEHVHRYIQSKGFIFSYQDIYHYIPPAKRSEHAGAEACQ